jgi:hypothetical protein
MISNNLKEEQKKEAISRMKKLKLYEPVIRDFKNGILYKSETRYGILYFLDEEEQERVKAFEQEHNATVYHVVKNNTEFGELETYFYVCAHKSEWYMDQEDIEMNVAMCYVQNLTDPSFSEFGSIGFQSANGGLVRVA